MIQLSVMDARCRDSGAESGQSYPQQMALPLSFGGDCSGATGATLQNVARPNGVVMISASATSSSARATGEDDELVLPYSPIRRTSGIQNCTQMCLWKEGCGFNCTDIPQTFGDYGKGLADSKSENELLKSTSWRSRNFCYTRDGLRVKLLN